MKINKYSKLENEMVKMGLTNPKFIEKIKYMAQDMENELEEYQKEMNVDKCTERLINKILNN